MGRPPDFDQAKKAFRQSGRFFGLVKEEDSSTSFTAIRGMDVYGWLVKYNHYFNVADMVLTP